MWPVEDRAAVRLLMYPADMRPSEWFAALQEPDYDRAFRFLMRSENKVPFPFNFYIGDGEEQPGFIYSEESTGRRQAMKPPPPLFGCNRPLY